MKFYRMLVWAIACFGMGLPAGHSSEGALPASKPAVRQEIVAVIEAQLAAFRAGDVGKAYHYAAAALRAQKSQAVFAGIVRDNYPEIWANTRAEFGIVRDDAAQATVTVQVFSGKAEASYDFTLVKETAGWRVQGVLRHAAKAGRV